MRKAVLILLLVIGFAGVVYAAKNGLSALKNEKATNMPQDNNIEGLLDTANPLSIDVLRKMDFAGSDLVIEEVLASGVNYNRYIASYLSEGNKIYGLLTIPTTKKPESGFPIIIFNHGYIPPKEYQTTERYVAYQDAFASGGYITFKSDYRGHGKSEGEASGGYGSNGYTIDVLNALASARKLKEADPKRVGMWGHSMGGFVTLRAMVVDPGIKAGVIWAGVVASYPDLVNNWRRRVSPPPPTPSGGVRRWRDVLIEQYGEPDDRNPFWKSLSANNYLMDISGPIQLHHGTADYSVPVEFSQKLEEQLKAAKKGVELYVYTGDDHNISLNFNTAITRSVEFFDRYVK